MNIAYFSAEYALEELPIFAGGLGVLAMDYLLEAGQSGIPLVGIGLFYSYGFALTDEAKPARLDPTTSGLELVQQNDTPLQQSLRLRGQDITYQIWYKRFGAATLYLLDCNVPANSPAIQQITGHLYADDFTTKVLQDAVLGMGGAQVVQHLHPEIELFHLNEGHTALAVLARLAFHRQAKQHATLPELLEAVRHETVASKHTVLSAAGLYIPKAQFVEIFSEYLTAQQLDTEEIFQLAQDPVRQDQFTTTRLMLAAAKKTNAVSQLHAVYEKKLHPGSPFKLGTVTNGVNIQRWQHPELAAASQDSSELWQLHGRLRGELITEVNQRTGSQLQPDILTLVWARRITAYKRPLEVFSDLDRLQGLLTNSERPVQLILAGKPNESDLVGVEMARQIGEHVLNPRFGGRMAYIGDYDLASAQLLVQGADVWLNTPERGYEASGTSGMKSGSSGGLQCSVSDGWIDEANLEDAAWILPPVNTAELFYTYLEHEIAPLFYTRNDSGVPEEWCRRMQVTIELITRDFSTARMLRDYRQQVYRLPET